MGIKRYNKTMLWKNILLLWKNSTCIFKELILRDTKIRTNTESSEGKIFKKCDRKIIL